MILSIRRKTKQVQTELNIEVRIVQIGKVIYKRLTFVNNALYHVVDVYNPENVEGKYNTYKTRGAWVA